MKARPRAEPRFVGAARRCLVSGERRAPEHLIRFAVDAAGQVVPDPGRAMGGRGMWLEPEAGLLIRLASGTVAEKKMFARAARRAVRVPVDLLIRTVEAHKAHCATLLARAERAGLVLRAATPEAAAEFKPAPLTRRLARDLECLTRLCAGKTE
jgi:predicted RNA-binding protein YlxR (DUF448 family)